MITSIQIHERIKQQLDSLKEKKESYEGVVARLIIQAEKQKRSQENLLKEGYKEMAQETLKITKDWSSSDIDWN